MAFLVTVVFGDIMQVLAADDEGSVHLGRDDGAGQDTATDGDQAGEGAFFVYRTERALVYPSVESFTESRLLSFVFFFFFFSSLHPFRISKFHPRTEPPPPPSSSIPNPLPPTPTKTQSKLTDISPLNGVLGSLETQANILVPSPSSLADPAVCGTSLVGEKDVGLLLESPLGLDGQFGGHGWCCCCCCCCGW